MSRVASCFLPARCLPLVRAAWLHNSSIWYRPPIYDWCFRGHRPLTSLRAVGVGAQGLQVRDGGSTPSPGPTDAAAERRSSLLSVLRSRGLLADVAGGAEGLTAAAAAGPLRVYCGFDPTAQSLHLGNLLCLMVLAWFQRCGHQAVALMGGATGRIGDPSGKSSERPVLDEAEVAANAASIARNVEALLQRVPGSTGEAPLVLDNYEWWSGMGLLDFLRDVGRHARVGTMLAKDSVRTRLESETGISFTEFSWSRLTPCWRPASRPRRLSERWRRRSPASCTARMGCGTRWPPPGPSPRGPARAAWTYRPWRRRWRAGRPSSPWTVRRRWGGR
ncbi:TSY1 [Auxenochlorella protothecoides x Auxenochlorella symbiontica]